MTIEREKTPYVELEIAGEALPRRVTRFELEQALKQPRATGWLELSDPDGAARAKGYDAFTQRLAAEVRGGRQGSALPASALLTGIVSREPFAPPGSRGLVRIDLADRWAVSDPVKVSLDVKVITPQDVLLRILQAAGLSASQLSARSFTARPLIVLDEWNLATAVKELATLWGLATSEDEWDRRLGLAVEEGLDWVALFTGEGLFVWDEWKATPMAAAAALSYTEDDLIAWSRGDALTAAGTESQKGQIETFFDPAAFPGMRLSLPDGEHRVEARAHRFNGQEFRTRVNYGPVP